MHCLQMENLFKVNDQLLHFISNVMERSMHYKVAYYTFLILTPFKLDNFLVENEIKCIFLFIHIPYIFKSNLD